MNLTEETVLPNLLRERARTRPDDVFLQHVDGEAATYGTFEARVRAWAGALAALGVRAGDTVLVMLPNSFASLEVWMAAARLGAIEVPINTAYLGSILSHVVDNAAAPVAVVHGDYLARFDDVLDTLDPAPTVIAVGDGASATDARVSVVTHDDALASAAPFDDVVSQAHDVSCIMYTSGTTGPSKGVMVPWAQVHSTTHGCIPQDDLGADDHWYSPFPLFHMSGKLAFCGAALLGSRFVVRNGFSTHRFWEEVNRFGCTISLLIGTTPGFLWSLPPTDDDASTPLHNVLMAPLPDEPAAFERRFGVRISTVFNMTEISCPIWTGWDRGPKASCGRLREGYQVRIADEQDREVPTGELGEILVRSDEPWLLMAGYWRMPDKTVRAWRNQWLHTGDAGRVDADGNYYFVDRQKDAIRRRGENISSMELEAIANEHPNVTESAAIGVPAELGEEEVHLFVVAATTDGVDPASVVDFLTTHAPRFMVPRYVSVATTLPKTPTEKVRKHLLRENRDDFVVWDREASGPAAPETAAR